MLMLVGMATLLLLLLLLLPLMLLLSLLFLMKMVIMTKPIISSSIIDSNWSIDTVYGHYLQSGDSVSNLDSDWSDVTYADFKTDLVRGAHFF